VFAGPIRLPAIHGHAHGAAVDFFVRPEHVRLAAMNGHVPPGHVAAEVRDSTFLGALTRVRIGLMELPEHPGVWADVPSAEAEGMRAGSRVTASWDAGAARVLAT
jgi:ABC-type Fe3+/spermidine/putrescine transport system ATPase subunit